MQVVFMGTPDFAVPSLSALVENKFRVAAVVTQPDRPGGRGKKLRPPAIKTYALQEGLPVLQPDKIRHREFIRHIRGLAPDVIVVAAFGRILPEEILNLPPYGCINVHASLLPAYRGAAPIHRAVINGEKETGVTIMQMDAGLDTGAMIMQDSVPIGAEDTTGDVHDRLARLGGELLVNALKLIAAGRARPVRQNEARSSYAHMLTGADEIIDWSWESSAIKNQVRGLNPWPVARTQLGDKLLKIWRVDIENEAPGTTGIPGQVLDAKDNRGITVRAGSGLVLIKELQLQGKKRMSAAEFIKGNPVPAGTVLGG